MECHKHDYTGYEDCPQCYAEGPLEIYPFDFDKDKFNQSELILIAKINELSKYIRELKGLDG